ncbi:hypothetical protein NESM_000295800 [Novymonas esmeraldas]|uniref:Uncharacterized protein n=1 Tax=Novymonas esmeraldas TaxID=1808958 RepID=A0AAW0FA17_9TRYP
MSSIIVAGATGAIGRAVVQHAIRQPSIGRVVALTRSANISAANYADLFGVVAADAAAGNGGGGGASAAGTVVATAEEVAKITPVTMDWEAFTRLWATNRSTTALEPYSGLFSGHAYAAMCLGTTRKDAGSADKFTRCDYDYVMAFTEAVLAYSAPAGLSPASVFVRHIGDKGSGAAAAADGAGTPTTIASSGTLRVFCQVSASGASSGSWFLYMKTKGLADESTVERVHQHNQLAAAAAQSPVRLVVLLPGLLERHGKTRTNEKVAKLFVSAIPVGTCGAAIVAASVQTPATEAPPGKPYTVSKALRKSGAPAHEPLAHIYQVHNAGIKELAARLPAP